MNFFSNIWEKVKGLKKHSRYLIIGGVVFILGVFFHFPLERFGSVITATIQRETGYIVQMEKLSLTFPIGITASDVTIEPPPSIKPFTLQINQLIVRPSIFSLMTYPLRKSIGFSYKIVRGKEVWNGSAYLGNENTELLVHVKNFEWAGSFSLDQNPMLAGQSVVIKTKLNVDLELSGKTISLQQGNFSEASGYLKMNSSQTDIQAPMIKTLNMTQLNLKSDLKKGTLTIDQLDFQAPNLSGKSSGSIKIEPFFPQSNLTMQAVLKPDPSDTNISSLLQLFGSLYNISPASDGTISLKISGSLNSPESLSIKSF